MKNDEFKVLRIADAKDETKESRTFFLEYPLSAKPGQFVMLWLPGAGEKPISVSGEKEGRFSVTVCAVGPVSKKIHKLKKGDKLGFRGPFGTHYSIPKDATSVALVGGGYGSAPLSFLAEEAIAQGKKVYFIEGARDKEHLLFEKRMEEAGAEVLLCTDDGSEGVKGFPTDVLKDVLKSSKIDKVYTCGPEIMMKKAAEISEHFGIPSELSMERYMKCGIGVCGQCAVDELGICLCKDGPILSGRTALSLKEFGKYFRDSSGKKIAYRK
jgi:dihydroorotate dehydrogenase electron transfer subunit